MQVFVPFKFPIAVASVLDPVRLNKQIVECGQILDALVPGTLSRWKNHPVVLMYRDHFTWLTLYRDCLREFKNGNIELSIMYDLEAEEICPSFLVDTGICEQHRRRLYTKDPKFYARWSGLGTSEENWYFVDGRIVKYVKGKRI